VSGGLNSHQKSIAWATAGIAILLTLSYLVRVYLNPNGHGQDVLYELVNVTTALAGALVIARQFRNPMGWILAFIGLAGLVTSLAQDYSVLANTVHQHSWPGGAFAAWLGSWLFLPPIAVLLTFGLLLFPDGRLPTPRWRWLAWLSGATLLLACAGAAIGSIPRPNFAIDDSGVLTDSSRLADLQALALLPFLAGAVCLISLIVRFRRSRGQEREQLKWFMFGGLIYAVGIAISVATVIGPSSNNRTPAWAGTIQEITTAAVPIAIAIAVLKYRLYDIELVISRTLLYGSLAAFITAVYVGIVVGVGTLVGSGGKPNLVLSIVATAIVAVAFQPVRERLQKIANRLVYGKRASPYEVLAQFSERVADTYAADEALPQMAKVLAEGTGAERAEVWLRAGTELRPTAAWPVSPSGNGAHQPAAEPVGVVGQKLPDIAGADRAVAVQHQGELLGALTVTKRAGESLTPIEEKLLDDLAHQAGLVLKNVGLTAELLHRLDELRASRQRLVAAQDEERRRLERNLHDGAQQNLVALKVKLGLAETFAERDPARAKELVTQLKADADEALETLRDLARGIYPPLLADKGLTAALESQARKATVPVEVSADGVGRYPQDVEAAVYFCCLEALQNVQKYAGASRVSLRLGEVAGTLEFEVQDDGKGFDPALARKGSGLTNMSDRLDALGGTFELASEPGAGATLRGSIPVRQTVPA
jgi:signal transduction histidine kinase